MILVSFLKLIPCQARVKSLLRVVAEQSELRPSLTSLTLTSFSSLARDAECGHRMEKMGCHDDRNQEPPSYDDLLK